jgi:mRNA interferase MazF
MKRGEIHLAAIPHTDGSPPKQRPVLIVQADYYNQRIQNVLVATITSNLNRRNDAAHLFIDVSTPEGKQSGLRVDSLVSCINIAVVAKKDLRANIGELSDRIMQQIDDCIRTAFGL